MSKHTPGPWAYSTSQEGWSYTINIFQADNAKPTDGWSDVGYIIKTCTGEQQAIQEANARLIAAAPDLLDALKALLDAADDSDGCQYGTLATSFVRNISRAAIAKAEGHV